MLKYIILPFSLLSLVGCKSNNTIENIQECNVTYPDSSNFNPKSNLYQAELDKVIQGGVPGVVALIYTPNEGVWMGASGYAQVENKIPMQPCNIFMSASVAKIYFAVLTLKLQELGKLSIEDKIDKFLDTETCDKIPNGHTAKIRHLLNHTTGIPDPSYTNAFLFDYLSNLKKAVSTEKYLSYIYHKEPLSIVGKKHNYSDANYILLALIIDKICGNHAQAMSDFIIKPNDLNETFYRKEAAYKDRTRLVNSYAELHKILGLRNVSEEERIFNESNIGHDGFKYTVYDNFLFFKKLFIDKTILDEHSLSLMMDTTVAHLRNGNSFLLGASYEVNDGLSSISHGGETIGSGNLSAYYPDKKSIIIICCNFGMASSKRLKNIILNRKSADACLINELENIAFN